MSNKKPEQGKYYRLPIEVNGKIVLARKYKGYHRFYSIDKNTIDVTDALGLGGRSSRKKFF